jgi:hypothetical protein
LLFAKDHFADAVCGFVCFSQIQLASIGLQPAKRKECFILQGKSDKLEA